MPRRAAGRSARGSGVHVVPDGRFLPFGTQQVRVAALGVLQNLRVRAPAGQGGDRAMVGFVVASARPDTWVTDRTGHIGYTFSLFKGGSDALEGVFGHG